MFPLCALGRDALQNLVDFMLALSIALRGPYLWDCAIRLLQELLCVFLSLFRNGFDACELVAQCKCGFQ